MAPMKKLISRNTKGQYRKIDYGRVKTIKGKKHFWLVSSADLGLVNQKVGGVEPHAYVCVHTCLCVGVLGDHAFMQTLCFDIP